MTQMLKNIAPDAELNIEQAAALEQVNEATEEYGVDDEAGIHNQRSTTDVSIAAASMHAARRYTQPDGTLSDSPDLAQADTEPDSRSSRSLVDFTPRDSSSMDDGDGLARAGTVAPETHTGVIKCAMLIYRHSNHRTCPLREFLESLSVNKETTTTIIANSGTLLDVVDIPSDAPIDIYISSKNQDWLGST